MLTSEIVHAGISLEYLFSTVEGGAGTKVAMNLVGNFGVQQGTSGDLLIGLPTQVAPAVQRAPHHKATLNPNLHRESLIPASSLRRDKRH